MTTRALGRAAFLSRVRVAVTVSFLTATGGMELAARRLCGALTEVGHNVTLLYGGGDPPAVAPFELVHAPSLLGDDLRQIQAKLKSTAPEVIVVIGGELAPLEAAARVAPTIHYALALPAICPDGSRYWYRAGTTCRLRAAGRICVALRPTMGCTEFQHTLRPGPYRRFRGYQRVIRDYGVGVLTPSRDLQMRFLAQGYEPKTVAVLPNLPARFTPEDLAEAAAATPNDLRDALLFLGRFAETKGVHLLPNLARALPGDARVVALGDGYLKDRLRDSAVEVRGVVTQRAVLGALLWARGVLFPSLWPEPGGIVGLDAQLVGTPVSAFRVGAPSDWIDVALFDVNDSAGVAGWGAQLPSRAEMRDPAQAARAQSLYWDAVANRGSALLEEFVTNRQWQGAHDHAVTECLRAAGVGPSKMSNGPADATLAPGLNRLR